MIKKILYIIFCISAVIVLSLNILSASNLSFFGVRIYRVGSGSMEPYLKEKDVIIIKSSSDYQLNDVITYKDNDEYITHRIVSINENEVITKGDANNTNDSPITKDKIVGKLIYKLKIFGFVSYLLSKPMSWVILFVVGFTITLLIPDSKKKHND